MGKAVTAESVPAHLIARISHPAQGGRNGVVAQPPLGAARRREHIAPSSRQGLDVAEKGTAWRARGTRCCWRIFLRYAAIRRSAASRSISAHSAARRSPGRTKTRGATFNPAITADDVTAGKVARRERMAQPLVGEHKLALVVCAPKIVRPSRAGEGSPRDTRALAFGRWISSTPATLDYGSQRRRDHRRPRHTRVYTLEWLSARLSDRHWLGRRFPSAVRPT
jgi:hypothetical protein